MWTYLLFCCQHQRVIDQHFTLCAAKKTFGRKILWAFQIDIFSLSNFSYIPYLPHQLLYNFQSSFALHLTITHYA